VQSATIPQAGIAAAAVPAAVADPDGFDEAAVLSGLERLAELQRLMTPPGELSSTLLSTLRRLERDGKHRLSDLAAAERVTQPGMTQVVSRLERDGLAVRGGHASDGRVVVVSITEAGRDLVRGRRDARAERLSAYLARLSEADRTAIAAAVPALDRLGALILNDFTPPAP
jgi:DNA-binding MarR family transcriptional regulator